MKRAHLNLLIDYGEENPFTEEELAQIEEAIEAVLCYEDWSGDVEISMTLVKASEIRFLNQRHRGVDEETDVLSFPIFPDDLPAFSGPKPLGDIVISMDHVRSQAKDFGHSEKRELLYLIVHSMFHLLGYDHIDEMDRSLMRQGEKAVMRQLGVYRYES